MPSRCSTQIGQTARMYFRPVDVLRLSPGASRRARRPRCCRSGIGTIPACAIVFAADRGQPGHQHRHRQRPTNNIAARPPVRDLPVDQRREARTTPPAPCCCPGSPRAAARQRGLRYVLGPAQMTGPFHRQRPGHAEPDRRSGWSTTRWPGRPAPPCGTRWPRRTSTSSSGSSSTASCTRRPIIQPTQASFTLVRRQG